MTLKLHPGGTLDHLGYILHFLNENDPDTATQQFDKNYQHGGGWQPFSGFTLRDNKSIKYPGNPALPIRVEISFRDEKIYVYDHAWFLVLQPDGAYEISRMD